MKRIRRLKVDRGLSKQAELRALQEREAELELEIEAEGEEEGLDGISAFYIPEAPIKEYNSVMERMRSLTRPVVFGRLR